MFGRLRSECRSLLKRLLVILKPRGFGFRELGLGLRGVELAEIGGMVCKDYHVSATALRAHRLSSAHKSILREAV